MSAKISNLRHYVIYKNASRPDCQPKIELAYLTGEQKKYLVGCLDCDLSPENLSCDGELPKAHVKQKRAYLMAVKAELATVTTP